MIGIIVYFTVHNPIEFSNHVFFDFVLPLIVFASGYTMKRRRFFRNIGPIAIYGVVVTMFCFMMIGISSYYVSEAGAI